MGQRKLSFYDRERQRYAGTSPLYGTHEHEFSVGDYMRDGGVGPRGEFVIYLYRFTNGRQRADELLTPQLRVFDDAFGALRAAEELGLLDALKRTKLRHRDDLSRLLLKLGMRDRSDNPLPKES